MEELAKELETAFMMPILPDKDTYKQYKLDHIFDEEESVRWNREEVLRRNQRYADEKYRLMKIRNQAIDEAERKIQEEIMQDTGLSKEKAKMLYHFCYERHHAYGAMEMLNHLSDYIDLFNDLKE